MPYMSKVQFYFSTIALVSICYRHFTAVLELSMQHQLVYIEITGITLIIQQIILEYGIFGEGSHISTNQKRESTVL